MMLYFIQFFFCNASVFIPQELQALMYQIHVQFILFMPCVYEAGGALPPFETSVLNHLCQNVFSKEAHI